MTVHFSIRDTVPDHSYTANTVVTTSDIPSHLWMRWTHVEPRIHRQPILKRGVWKSDDVRFCFDVYQDLEQQEDGDTTEHTFLFEPCTDCFQFWYYLWGYVGGVVSPSTTVIFKYPDLGNCPPAPTGTILGLIDALEFDPSLGIVPQIIRVSPTTYAIAYQGPYNDGWLRTVQILADGTITGEIDSWEFDIYYGRMPSIVHVHGNVYAIAYSGVGGNGTVRTVTISATGVIGPLISSYIFEPGGQANHPQIRHISGTTYSIWYQGPGNDGWTCTLRIHNDGMIGPLLDSAEWDAVYAAYATPRHISGNVWACAYRGPATPSNARLITHTITAAGHIGPIIATRDFDDAYGIRPDLFHVSGTVYGIAYRGPDGDGWLKTINISGAGAIGPIIHAWELDPVHGDYISVTPVGHNIWAVSYQGPDYDGWLKTIEIHPTGTITGQIDQLEFDPTYGAYTHIIHVLDNTYALVYTGPGTDGWLRTVAIATP